MSPAHELALYLEAQGVGAFGGNDPWSIHVSRSPEQPADVVVLYDTAGGDPIVADGADLRQPGIQVRVRSFDYAEAFEVQEEIRTILAAPLAVDGGEVLEREIGDARYVAINPVGDMISLGRDENDRQVIVANYRCIRQPLGGS